jgi:hypothetical protein
MSSPDLVLPISIAVSLGDIGVGRVAPFAFAFSSATRALQLATSPLDTVHPALGLFEPVCLGCVLPPLLPADT